MHARQRGTYRTAAEAAASLAELCGIERALAHILAGWAVRMPAFEAKRAFAFHMHRAMERASQLRGRVNGLSHATADAPSVTEGLCAALEHLDRADTPGRLLAGVYGWLYPRLIALYEAHAREADPVGDRPSRELIASFLPALERERKEGLALARTKTREDKAWLRELEDLWQAKECGARRSLDAALWRPVSRVPAAARPDWAEFCESGSLGLVVVDPLNDAQDIGMFLHKELDEEYTTLELVARNSYEHPDMEWAFHRDMLRQASDEARHAVLITRLMAARGFRHGDFAVSPATYDGLYEFEPCAPGSRDELLWRMLIRQTFMEGLAIDSLATEIERRRAAGQTDIAEAFEYILRDEVFHAGSGLKWSRVLLDGDEAAMLAAREEALGCFTARAEAAREAYVMDNLDAAMEELAAIEAGKAERGGPPARPLNRVGRAQAGYSEADIAQVVAWGYASDEPASH